MAQRELLFSGIGYGLGSGFFDVIYDIKPSTDEEFQRLKSMILSDDIKVTYRVLAIDFLPDDQLLDLIRTVYVALLADAAYKFVILAKPPMMLTVANVINAGGSRLKAFFDKLVDQIVYYDTPDYEFLKKLDMYVMMPVKLIQYYKNSLLPYTFRLIVEVDRDENMPELIKKMPLNSRLMVAKGKTASGFPIPTGIELRYSKPDEQSENEQEGGANESKEVQKEVNEGD